MTGIWYLRRSKELSVRRMLIITSRSTHRHDTARILRGTTRGRGVEDVTCTRTAPVVAHPILLRLGKHIGWRGRDEEAAKPPASSRGARRGLQHRPNEGF